MEAVRLVLMCVSARLALAALGFAREATGTAARHPRLVRKVFPGVTVDRCRGFRVSAKGSAGSRATLVRRALPECAPS
jgi:hypothetical protein